MNGLPQQSSSSLIQLIAGGTAGTAKDRAFAGLRQPESQLESLGKRVLNQLRQEPLVKLSLSLALGQKRTSGQLHNFGASAHMDYTVIGAQVNLAARLQGLAKPGEVIMSSSTYGEVKGLVEVEPRGDVNVKGLAKPVSIYLLKGLVK